MKRVAAALTLVLTASPALAQRDTEVDTGSHISVPTRARIPGDAKSPDDAARIAISQFARCVVARNPVGVSRALGMSNGPDYWKAMGQVATDQCLDSGSLHMPQKVMRGAIFVEVYRLSTSKKQVLVAPLPLDFSNPLLPEYRSDPQRYALLAFADCVIKRDPGAARTVVLASPATPSQDAAFKAIMPNLGPCLVAGQKVAFSKPILEGVLAEVLYREAVAPVALAGTK